MLQTEKLLSYYRSLPWFRGKLRIGKLVFKRWVDLDNEIFFKAHYNVKYKIPNTKENVGLELLINGIYEKEIIDFLLKNIKSNCVFFDVGANIGAIGLPILKQRKSIQYIAFEASPWVADYLKYNLQQNDIKNYEVINRIVHHNNNEKLRFYQSELYGKSSLAPTYTHKFIEINSITLDNYCIERGIQSIDWLKVDVQGFELDVFKGAQRMLGGKKVKNILFEYEPWAEDQAKIAIGEAQRYISGFGYQLFDIHGKNWSNSNNTDTMIWAKAFV